MTLRCLFCSEMSVFYEQLLMLKNKNIVKTVCKILGLLLSVLSGTVEVS